MVYTTRRALLVNGKRYQAGEVVPGAEQLHNIRRLLSAGYLRIEEMPVTPPPASPADSKKTSQGAKKTKTITKVK